MKIKFFVLIFFIGINLYSQNVGNTGYSFMKIGIGASEVAVAEAVTSKAFSPFSLNYNPALLSQLDFSSIGFMHNEWIQGVRSDILIGNSNFFGVPIFVLINSTKISDIEIRTRPGDLEGIFDAHYFHGGIGTAFKLYDKWLIGVQVKYLYENIYVDESEGYALDFGILKKDMLYDINLGISFRNLGKVNRLAYESAELPDELRLGLSYENLNYKNFKVTPVLDLQKYLDAKRLNLLFGIEVNYDNLLILRTGYNSTRDLNNFSFGLGLMYKFVSFDYAFLPFSENFGNANLISITVKL